MWVLPSDPANGMGATGTVALMPVITCGSSGPTALLGDVPGVDPPVAAVAAVPPEPAAAVEPGEPDEVDVEVHAPSSDSAVRRPTAPSPIRVRLMRAQG